MNLKTVEMRLSHSMLQLKPCQLELEHCENDAFAMKNMNGGADCVSLLMQRRLKKSVSCFSALSSACVINVFVSTPLSWM